MMNFLLPNNLTCSYEKKSFYEDTSNDEVLKYLKGVYKIKSRFTKDFLSKITNPILDDFRKFLDDSFDDCIEFTYEEAFKLKNNEFRIKVFDTINIGDMIKSLGCELIKVEGIKVDRKQFDKSGKTLPNKEYDNVYETYRVFGKNLNISTNVYALKCWCTSTNKEHWLWIDEKYKDNPLDAVASTFRIHENLIPHIKELKRQGDLMFVELIEKISPEGNIVPLTREQYFGLLTSET